jgi:hypothetical protein
MALADCGKDIRQRAANPRRIDDVVMVVVECHRYLARQRIAR